MTRVIVQLIDATVIHRINGDDAALAAQSYVRKLKREGITYKGAYYGPGGIVKIEIKEGEDGRQT